MKFISAGPEALPPRFVEKVDFTTSCWLWTAYRNENGYGRFWHEGHLRPAHRVSYELLVGSIDPGLVLDHLCRVRHCVNPGHLEPVTERENLVRGTGWAGRHAAKTHCPQGHPYSEANTYTGNGRRKCRICQHARYLRRYYGVASGSGGKP